MSTLQLDRIAGLSKELRKPCPPSQHVPDQNGKLCGRCKGHGYVPMTFDEVLIKIWAEGGSIGLEQGAVGVSLPFAMVPQDQRGSAMKLASDEEPPSEELILAAIISALGGDIIKSAS